MPNIATQFGWTALENIRGTTHATEHLAKIVNVHGPREIQFVRIFSYFCFFLGHNQSFLHFRHALNFSFFISLFRITTDAKQLHESVLFFF